MTFNMVNTATLVYANVGYGIYYLHISDILEIITLNNLYKQDNLVPEVVGIKMTSGM
jgi:hypothetical protein